MKHQEDRRAASCLKLSQKLTQKCNTAMMRQMASSFSCLRSYRKEPATTRYTWCGVPQRLDPPHITMGEIAELQEKKKGK